MILYFKGMIFKILNCRWLQLPLASIAVGFNCRWLQLPLASIAVGFRGCVIMNFSLFKITF